MCYIQSHNKISSNTETAVRASLQKSTLKNETLNLNGFMLEIKHKEASLASLQNCSEKLKT